MEPQTLNLSPDSHAMAYVRSFMRCYMAGVGFNTRGMQNVGLMYAMQPGLAVIHSNPKDLKAAQKRYVGHYQSHPFWLPCLVGIYLHVEATIAAGRFPPKMLGKVKDTTAYTLSALGDSVFGGSMLIFWVLMTICLLLSGQATASLIMGICFFLGLQVFRVYTFIGGVRHGFKFLERLKRWDLINWGRRIKYANAMLILWLWVLIWPKPFTWWEWLTGVTALMLFGRSVRTGLISRAIAAAVFILFIDNFDMLEQSVRSAINL